MLKRIVIYTIQVVDFDVKTIFYVDSLRVHPSLWVDFFEKKFMAEKDRHQLALAYDAVVSSGVL